MVDDNNKENSSEPKDIQYVRKKNIIPGWDNDFLFWITLVGVGGLVAYPHLKAWADNIVNSMRQGQPGMAQQLPPNGAGIPQQQVLNPPVTESQNKVTYVQPNIDQPKLSPLEEHEKAIRDQQAYAAAMEKESLTASQSISMVPERTPRERKHYTYEAGSNVSAGF